MTSDVDSSFGFSAESREKLRLYQELLGKWNKRINLVSPETTANSWVRHFLDSAQLIDISSENPKIWVDLGSGGGFPGLVSAILAKDLGWATEFYLVESDQRKSAFLRTVSRETEVGVTVVTARAEEVEPLNAAVVSARALAPLYRLLPLVQRHSALDSVALLQKGRSYQQELKESRDKLTFDLEIHRSRTDSEAVVLEVGNISNV